MTRGKTQANRPTELNEHGNIMRRTAENQNQEQKINKTTDVFYQPCVYGNKRT